MTEALNLNNPNQITPAEDILDSQIAEESTIREDVYGKIGGKSLEEWAEVDAAARNWAKNQEAISAIEEVQAEEGVTFGTNLQQLMREDPETNYKMMKKLTHDYAHIESSEQAVANFFELNEYKSTYSDMLTPEEAERYTSEFGIDDLKFDKNITRGEVMWKIKEREYKKSLEQQFAFYAETGDYTALQNIALMGSAISGGVGAAEVAATILLGIGTAATFGATAPALAAQAARFVPMAKNVANGIRLGQKAMLAERIANTAKNSTKIINSATKAQMSANYLAKAGQAQRLAQEGGFLSQFGYDAMRFSQGAVGGAGRAGLLSTATAFALDGVASELPMMALRAGNSIMKDDDSYTTKDAIIELMCAGTFAGLMPVAGTVAKGFVPISGKMVKGASDTIANTFDGAVKRATSKGYTKDAEDITKIHQAVDEKVKSVYSSVEGKQTLGQQVAQFMAQDNRTETEMLDAIYYIKDCIQKGKPIHLAAMPGRNKFLSSFGGFYDFVKAGAKHGLTNEQMLNEMARRGVAMDLKGTDLLKDGFLSLAKITDEQGALGRFSAAGFNQKQALEFMMDTYRFNFLNDTEAGVRALQQVENMRNVKNKIDTLIETYDKVFGQSYKGVQSTAYQLNDGTFGDFRSALEEVVELLGTPEEISEVAWARGIREQIQKQTMDKGHPDITMADDAARAEEIMARFEKRMEEVAEYVESEGHTYYNLKVRGKAKDNEALGEKTFLQNISDELGLMADQNEALLDSERLLMEKYPDPDALLKEINDLGPDIPELRFNYVGERKLYSSGEELATSTARRNTTMMAYNALKESDGATYNLLEKACATFDKVFKQGDREVRSSFIKQQEIIDTTQKMLETDFIDVRKQIIRALQDNKIMAELLTEMTTNRSVEKVADKLRSPKSPLRQILEDQVVAPIQDSLSIGVVRDRQTRTAIMNAVDSFVENLNKEDLSTLLTKVKYTTEDMTKDVAAAQQEIKQIDIIDKAMKPLIDELGVIAMDAQNMAYRSRLVMLEGFTDMLKNPANASEALMARFSSTFMNIKGAALSVENLTNPVVLLKQLRKSIATAGLEKEAYGQGGKTNFTEIMRSLYYMNKYETGEAVKNASGIDVNSNVSVIAGKYLDALTELEHQLYLAGSGKKKLLNLFNPRLLSQAANWLPVNAGDASRAAVQRMQGRSAYGKISEMLTRLAPESGMDRDMSVSNLAHYLFENLDLDTQFNTSSKAFLKLNEIRDAILDQSGIALDKLVQIHKPENVEKGLKFIIDNIVGVQDNIAKGVIGKRGIIDKLTVESNNIIDDKNCFRAKFLDDLEQRLFFKNDEAEVAATNYWGYKSFEEMAESNLTAGRRAYAVLSKAGASPREYVDEMIAAFNTFVSSDDAVKMFGKKAVKKMGISTEISGNLGTKFNQKASIMAAMRTVCGFDSVPACNMAKFVNGLQRLVGAPMLAKAGLKSFSDPFYQHSYLVDVGLRSAWDVTKWGDTIGKTVGFMRSNKLADHMLLNHVLRNETINQLLSNESLSTGPVTTMNKWAPWQDRFEQGATDISNFIMDKMAWIGPITEYNRSNAALSIMEAVAEVSGTQFKDLNTVLQGMLGKHGINAFEWDNIFSKYAVTTIGDYSKGMGKADIGTLADKRMFCADILADLDDDTVKGFLEAQGTSKVTKEMIDSYRLNLVDKAMVMINAGASEMTSMPTARIQNALTLWQAPNSTGATIAKIFTKFQSFSMAVTQLHWGRLLAKYVDPTDPVSSNIIKDVFRSHPVAATGSVLSFLMGSMITQQAIAEAIAYISGTPQSFTNEKGEVNWKNKVLKPFTDSLGIAGPLFDAITTSLDSRGQGGGIAIAAAPVPSRLLRTAGDLARTQTRKGTEDNRAGAFAAQLGREFGEYSGISRFAYTQAAWAWLFGDTLKEYSMGSADYRRYRTRREKEGYQESWLQQATEQDRMNW